MKTTIILFTVGWVVTACASPKERLASCSPDENPVPALEYTDREVRRAAPMFAAQPLLQSADRCGPMQAVNVFD